MAIIHRQPVLRLIITFIICTLLLSCGNAENSAQENNGAGIAFRLKWPVAKSVGSVPAEIPPGVVTIRMSVSGPDMKTMSRDFPVSPASPRTGSIESVPVGINRTITLQGLASNGDIIFQDVDTNVTLKPLLSDPPYSHAFEMKFVATSSTPTAPSGLSVTVVSANQVDLTWVNNVNNETGYIIERKAEADPTSTYTQIATVAANDTSYTDTISDATKYDYQVRANNLVTVATATTTVVVPVITYSISGTITTSSGNAVSGVTVTRYLNGSTSRSTDSVGNYSFAGTQNGKYTITPSKTGYTFYPLTLDAEVDGANISAKNFVATAVETAPAAPTGLSATAYTSNSIYLAWKDSANESGYRIERSTVSGGGYVKIAEVAANVTTYNDTALSASTTYYYRVRATNNIGDSGYSNEVSAKTPTPTYSISGAITSGGSALAGVTVTLSGNDSRSTKTDIAGGFRFSGAIDGSYTLTPVMAGYDLSPLNMPAVVNGANLSAMNFSATANTPPLAPSGLTATVASSSSIDLAWVDNANNESGYIIERKTGSGGDYATVATVAANVKSYNETGLSASTTYYYRMRATNVVGDSGNTAEANVTTTTVISPALVYVAGGTFTMGDTFGDGDLDELPTHQVTVGNFSIGKFEVTQGEWFAVMGGPNPPSSPEYPVVNVSRNLILNFITKLNTLSGKSYRLPTEAEWEYAARSGGLNQKYSGSSDVNAVAWYKSNAGGKTHPVGTLAPNDLGIHDMSGNVWDLVSDWYGSYSSADQTDPDGPFAGSDLVLRGGSYVFDAGNARTTNRFAYPANLGGHATFGFRLAK